MTVSLLDLTTPLTKEQVESAIYDTMAGLGVNTTGWKAGSVARAIVTGVSIVQSAFSVLQSAVIAQQYLDFAEGDWLKLLAKYGFGINIDLLGATFATGQLTLTNSGGGVYTLDPGDYVARNPDTLKTYKNTASFTLGAVSSITIAIQAEEAGADSTSGPGQITESTTPLGGVTNSNAAAVVGRDPETDPNIRTLCRQKLGALSPNGPADAYAYFAKTATRPDGSNVGVRRTRNAPDGYGRLTTYVASATGALSNDDLAIVDEAIQKKAAPLCVTATTSNATNKTIAVSYTAIMYNTSGDTEAEIKDNIDDSIANFFAIEPIGGNEANGQGTGRVYMDAIKAAIVAAYPAQIFHVILAAPVLDPEMGLSDIPILGTVTGVITQVAPAAGIG